MLQRFLVARSGKLAASQPLFGIRSGPLIPWIGCWGSWPRRLQTVSVSRDDVCIRLPDWSRFVFGNLAWSPVPTRGMWVGLGRVSWIAHEPSSLVWHTSLALKQVYDLACPETYATHLRVA